MSLLGKIDRYKAAIDELRPAVERLRFAPYAVLSSPGTIGRQGTLSALRARCIGSVCAVCAARVVKGYTLKCQTL